MPLEPTKIRQLLIFNLYYSYLDISLHGKKFSGIVYTFDNFNSYHEDFLIISY